MSAARLYPGWLPDPVSFYGNWDSFVRTLYVVFETDFKHGYPRYRSRPIWHDRRVESGDSYGYEEGFWHLVTKDEWVWNSATRHKEKTRLPELDRAARLPWTKPAIDNDSVPEVLTWDFEQNVRNRNVTRTYIWLKQYDFVVVLERQAKRRGDIFMLITSFHVDHGGKRNDLESRYKRRIK